MFEAKGGVCGNRVDFNALWGQFHINNKHAPVWEGGYESSFSSQSQETQLYYALEFMKLRRGIRYGNFKMSGWLYYHLNYFNIEQDVLSSDGVTTVTNLAHPKLRDIEFIINHHLILAETFRKGLIMFGSRRIGKSAFEASYLSYSSIVKRGGPERPCLIAGESEKDIGNVTSYLDKNALSIHPFLHLTPLTTTYGGKKGVQYGYKSVQGISTIHSVIQSINLSSSSQALAGQSPNALCIDECGKFDVSSHYSVLKPALATPYGWRTCPIMTGTGGETKLALPASTLFYNPGKSQFVEIDWGIVNRGIENPTWETGTQCGVFFPGQMSINFQKKSKPMSKFLGIEDKFLDKIDIELSTIDKNTTKLRNQFVVQKSLGEKEYLDEMKGFPLDIKSCFIESGENPFPVNDCLIRKMEIINEGRGNMGFDVKWNGKNLDVNPTQRSIVTDYPFKGGAFDAAVQIFVQPPKKPDFDMNRFVGGLDCYKQALATTSSLGSCYIMSRPPSGRPDLFKIAASLVTRPMEPAKYYAQVRDIQYGYGAVIFQEAADLGYEEYLKLKYRSEMRQLLADGRKAVQLLLSGRGTVANTKFGWFPSPKTKSHVFSLSVQYANEEVEYRLPNGESVIKKGVYRIDDVGLLDEMIGSKPGINADRLTAFGSALWWCSNLDSRNILPSDENVQVQKDELADMSVAELREYRYRIKQQSILFKQKIKNELRRN